MDIPALRTDEAIGVWPQPFEVEEARQGRVELRASMPKPVFLADFTSEMETSDFERLRLTSEISCHNRDVGGVIVLSWSF